jgi:HEAT repeat protein
LAELAQIVTADPLEQSQAAQDFAASVIAHLNAEAERLSVKHKVRFTLAESRDATAPHRLARLDLKFADHSGGAINLGGESSSEIFYTNSTKLPVNSGAGAFDRIHIESDLQGGMIRNAVTDLWLGAALPPTDEIVELISQAFHKTQASAIAFSPDFTVCDVCHMVLRGLLSNCPQCGSMRVDGLAQATNRYSRISTWPRWKLAELNQRERSALFKISGASAPRGIGKAAEKPLNTASKGSDIEMAREAAVRAIALSKWEEVITLGAAAVEPLIAAIKGNDVDVRGNAVMALGKVSDARAVEPLIVALKDSDENVRWLAAENLGRIGDARAVEPLIAALKDTRVFVRQTAVEALGRIGDVRAMEPLMTILRDQAGSVRSKAAAVLEKLWASESRQSLEEYRECEEEEAPVRRRIEEISNLVGTADPRNLPKFLLALNDESAEVRRRAMWAIWQFWWTGDLLAIGTLINALKDSDSEIREIAAKAMGKYIVKFDETPSALIQGTQLRRQEALDALVAALKDPDQDVARVAAEALANIKGEK